MNCQVSQTFASQTGFLAVSPPVIEETKDVLEFYIDLEEKGFVLSFFFLFEIRFFMLPRLVRDLQFQQSSWLSIPLS